MNKPDDVSQEAWDTAKTKDGFDYKFPVKVIVARAIDAAIAKERERCSTIAEEYDGDGLDASQYAQLGDAFITKQDIASLIRNSQR